MSDEPSKDDLRARVNKLEKQVESLLPSRREFLKVSAAGLGGGALALSSQPGAAQSPAGQIGEPANPVDVYAHEIGDSNNPVENIYSNDQTFSNITVNGKATLEKSVIEFTGNNSDGHGLEVIDNSTGNSEQIAIKGPTTASTELIFKDLSDTYKWGFRGNDAGNFLLENHDNLTSRVRLVKQGATELLNADVTVPDGKLTAAARFEVPRLSADPSSPSNGEIWYRTDLDEYRGVEAGTVVTFSTS